MCYFLLVRLLKDPQAPRSQAEDVPDGHLVQEDVFVVVVADKADKGEDVTIGGSVAGQAIVVGRRARDRHGAGRCEHGAERGGHEGPTAEEDGSHGSWVRFTRAN